MLKDPLALSLSLLFSKSRKRTERERNRNILSETWKQNKQTVLNRACIPFSSLIWLPKTYSPAAPPAGESHYKPGIPAHQISTACSRAWSKAHLAYHIVSSQTSIRFIGTVRNTGTKANQTTNTASPGVNFIPGMITPVPLSWTVGNRAFRFTGDFWKVSGWHENHHAAFSNPSSPLLPRHPSHAWWQQLELQGGGGMRKSGYTPLGETLPSGQSWSENNSSSTPHGCRALKTLLVFLMLKIPSGFMKLQCQWISGSYLSCCSCRNARSSKDNSRNLPKGFWRSSPVSCQSHHPPFHAGQP